MGFACLGLVAIMSGGTLEIRHHLLLGALAFVLGIALLVVVAGSYEGTPGK